MACANGILHRLETGGALERKGVQVNWLHVILAGHLVLSVDRGSGPQKAIEWHAGEVSGILPYSREWGARRAMRLHKSQWSILPFPAYVCAR